MFCKFQHIQMRIFKNVKYKRYLDVCDAVYPTHHVYMRICTEDCTAIYKSLEKITSSAVCLHYSNTQHFRLLFCTLDHFSLYYNSILCWFHSRKKERWLKSVEKLMREERRRGSNQAMVFM